MPPPTTAPPPPRRAPGPRSPSRSIGARPPPRWPRPPTPRSERAATPEAPRRYPRRAMPATREEPAAGLSHGHQVFQTGEGRRADAGDREQVFDGREPPVLLTPVEDALRHRRP